MWSLAITIMKGNGVTDAIVEYLFSENDGVNIILILQKTQPHNVKTCDTVSAY